MILRPVKPASPWGPPITKAPHGLMWTMVLSSKYCSGMTTLTTFSKTSERNSSSEIFSECWTETTTVWTRCGMQAPFWKIYSAVTWQRETRKSAKYFLTRRKCQQLRLQKFNKVAITVNQQIFEWFCKHHKRRDGVEELVAKLTWVFESGRAHGKVPSRRRSAMSWFKRWARTTVSGMHSSVSSVAYPNIKPCKYSSSRY